MVKLLDDGVWHVARMPPEREEVRSSGKQPYWGNHREFSDADTVQGDLCGSYRFNQSRSAIKRLVLEIARAGLSPFGQVLVQFMMVWQR